MMRFILDCLRAGRRRTACARENSVELQAKDKEAAGENEIKGLEDVVAMEAGELQKERGLSRDAQQALESLAKRRAQLKEEIEGIQEQRKQEGQLLLSLQEEQEELDQTVQEYEKELQRARDELQCLHEEIGKARARVEDAHGRMGLLKHSISETYTEITETKERLGELIAEMMAIEACVPEITCHQVGEPLSLDLDDSSEEEEEDAEECYGHVYEDENPIKQITVDKDRYEQNVEGLEKVQHSAENLKSSGSSSFTEITLTEVKEEDASPRSNTPQHMDSPDLEEEDFEIVQSIDTKSVSQTTSREFDFYHPDPFVDYDVFGDERFPKVDMTEFLSGDPFKGTDPFASDILFNDVADAQFSQDYRLTEESKAKEPDPLYTGPESTSKDEHADTANPVNQIFAGANCSQSIDSGMFEQNVPEPSDSERYTPYSDICPDVGMNITGSQELDSMDVNITIRTEYDLPASFQPDDEGRFDPIHCEHDDIHEPGSSDSSTVDSSFDGDFCTFTGMEHPESELQAEPGPSYVRRNQALYGLQRIDTSSYTSFPLSPEDYVPEPVGAIAEDEEKPVEAADPFSCHSDHDAVSEIKPEINDTERLSPHIEIDNPGPLCQEFSEACDVNHVSHENNATHSPDPSDLDAYDHKFGDIYFFTVRLDPGSPDASPVSAEASDRKKSEGDHTSPESNDTDEFDCGGPEEEDPNQYNLEAYVEESFDKEESPVGREEPLSPKPDEPVPYESEIRSPIEYFPYPEHGDQSAGLEVFDHSACTLESNNALMYISENTENVDPVYKADIISKNCNSDSVDQYLISPVSGDTGLANTDRLKLCAHNPFSLESGSIEHYDNFESSPEPFNPKSLKESDLCDSRVLDSFSPLPNNTTCEFEVIHPNTVNSESTEGGRLDSGYHENSGLETFSPAPADTHSSADMGPIFVSPNQEVLSPGTLDLETPDPFSPESNDTMIFDSGICNPPNNNGAMKDSCTAYTASSDVLGDSFSGSELDSFDPFSPVPHITGGSYTHCGMDILVPGLIQNNSKSNGETRSSSCDSGVSHSPQLHCGSAQNRDDSHNLSYLSNCSTKDLFFESDSCTSTETGSFNANVEKITEQDKNSAENVTAMAELAEIDFFCSELSKMVTSHSSDAVQQSVAEMLFGSNPDTARFYPWDFENSSMVGNEASSPEADSENGHKLSKDLPKLEAGTRTNRSSDLLGELCSAVGHTVDEAERPCLL